MDVSYSYLLDLIGHYSLYSCLPSGTLLFFSFVYSYALINASVNYVILHWVAQMKEWFLIIASPSVGSS